MTKTTKVMKKREKEAYKKVFKLMRASQRGMGMKTTKVKRVKGELDVWSLLKQMNTDHEDFGRVAAFLNGMKWIVEVTPINTSDT